METKTNPNLRLVNQDGCTVYPHETILKDKDGYWFKMDSWDGDAVYVVPFGEGARQGFRSREPFSRFGLRVVEHTSRCPICGSSNCKAPNCGERV
jgi:hypothetical protein